VADRATYEKARADVVRTVVRRLSAGARFSVPEPRVQNAQLALLGQQIAYTWKYSVGNAYEELSFAEALDTAQVMARYGFADVAKAILRASLHRLSGHFTAWRAGERLVAGAVYYQLFRDRRFLEEEAGELSQAVKTLASRQITTGPNCGRLRPEPLCSDIPEPVDEVAGQLVAWQGLLAMERVWSSTAHPRLAARARRVGLRLEVALRKAVRESIVRLPDGSIFVPSVFSRTSRPYDLLIKTRAGSYWNLVMPFGLASGFFRAGSPEAKGLVKYLLLHGSRLLGVTRADAHTLYDDERYPVSGLTGVYGLNVSRFFADNDQADQLVLSLYGLLAAGMTPGTYISGEAVSVTPIGGAYYRTTYLPPNLGANSTFLETLRLMLVQERRGPRGAPRGLDLAFSTPRRWLADGKTIRVDRAPTSFGRVSFSIERHGRVVRVRVSPPTSPPPPSLRLRLRLPAGERLTAVRVGAERMPFDVKTGTIDLSGRKGRVDLRADVYR